MARSALSLSKTVFQTECDLVYFIHRTSPGSTVATLGDTTPAVFPYWGCSELMSAQSAKRRVGGIVGLTLWTYQVHVVATRSTG